MGSAAKTIQVVLISLLMAISANAVASTLVTFEDVVLDPERGIYHVEVSSIGSVKFDNQVCGSRCIDGISVQDMEKTFITLHLWGSGPQVGTISNGTSLSVAGGGLFDLESAYIGMSHPHQLQYDSSLYWVIANGYANGNLLYSARLSPGQTASLINFDWRGIDRLAFNTRIGGGYVVIDDISLSTLSPVPAPPAFILMLTGLGMLGLAKRFRKADKEV